MSEVSAPAPTVVPAGACVLVWHLGKLYVVKSDGSWQTLGGY